MISRLLRHTHRVTRRTKTIIHKRFKGGGGASGGGGGGFSGSSSKYVITLSLARFLESKTQSRDEKLKQMGNAHWI